ncbi:MAG: glycosyltransferase [Tannerellaceae bacterium]|nr:glycosyltransferase [Tannerellaceae bacterium]
MGFLCKYLPFYGWEAIVVAENTSDEYTAPFPSGFVETRWVNFYPQSPKWLRNITWGLTFVADMLVGYKDRRMYREVKKVCETQHFDALLCSTFRSFPLMAAVRIAKHYNLPMVADLRDILEQCPQDKGEYTEHKLKLPLLLRQAVLKRFRAIHLYRRNKALRQASAVTTVSRWHVETLSRYNPRTELIYNGYDPELFHPQAIASDHFLITYTGRLLSTTVNDPSLLMQALRRLTEEGFLTPERCKVQWYIDESSRRVVEEESSKEGVEAYMDIHGFVPAMEVPRILNGSSVLLLLTNLSSDRGTQGIMTTKFFEYLAIGKPVLCVRSDEGCLSAALEESKAGVAATTVEEVSDFLKQQYTLWQEKGQTSVSVPPDVLQRYSRKEQAGRFAQLLEEVSL